MVLGLANSTLSGIEKGFSISQLCIFWMLTWASGNLPLNDNMITPGIMSSWEKRAIVSSEFFVCLKREQTPETSE